MGKCAVKFSRREMAASLSRLSFSSQSDWKGMSNG
jgi:hypothetical protein